MIHFSAKLMGTDIRYALEFPDVKYLPQKEDVVAVNGVVGSVERVIHNLDKGYVAIDLIISSEFSVDYMESRGWKRQQ